MRLKGGNWKRVEDRWPDGGLSLVSTQRVPYEGTGILNIVRGWHEDGSMDFQKIIFDTHSVLTIWEGRRARVQTIQHWKGALERTERALKEGTKRALISK